MLMVCREPAAYVIRKRHNVEWLLSGSFQRYQYNLGVTLRLSCPSPFRVVDDSRNSTHLGILDDTVVTLCVLRRRFERLLTETLDHDGNYLWNRIHRLVQHFETSSSVFDSVPRLSDEDPLPIICDLQPERLFLKALQVQEAQCIVVKQQCLRTLLQMFSA